MPTVLEKINLRNYTPTEAELTPKLEEIIFSINIQTNTQFTRGAKFSEIVSGLEKNGVYYSDAFILTTLKKMKDDFILQEIDDKWYSCMF